MSDQRFPLEMKSILKNINIKLIKHLRQNPILTQNHHLSLTAPRAAPKIKLNTTSSFVDTQNKGYAKCAIQKLLPFPAIPLDKTLRKLVETSRPLLNECEFKQSCAAIAQFECCEGQKLQSLLETAAKQEENWLATRWLKTAYLRPRDSVVIYCSPGMVFPIQKFQCPDDYFQYTAKLVYGAVKYKRLIDEGEIPVFKMGGLELDNSQFNKVFGTTRVPGIKQDLMEYHPESKHIIIMCKNNFFKLNVLNDNACILHPQKIYQELKSIYADCGYGPAIGLMTADHRDNWGKIYQELMHNHCNERTIEFVKTSLFTVHLDQNVPLCGDPNTVACAQLLHGGGPEQNAPNRWFDKTIQLISNPNGVNGFCYEHSPAEGAAIASMTDYMLDLIKKCPPELCISNKPDTCADECANSEKLPIVLDTLLADFISTAGCNLRTLITDLQMQVLKFNCFGKSYMKKQKLSPDSFIQVAIQYAFQKMHGMPGAHYESAHLRIYYGGRTETIRSCSLETVDFYRAMCECCCIPDKAKAFRKAVESHNKYTRIALEGKGVDRHLLGLKLMALEHNMPLPDFFSCPAVVKSAHYRISTSQVASNNDAYMCYGPLTNDGYGCCYNPHDNNIIFAVSSWASNNATCATRFAATVEAALKEIKAILDQCPPNCEPPKFEPKCEPPKFVPPKCEPPQCEPPKCEQPKAKL